MPAPFEKVKGSWNWIRDRATMMSKLNPIATGYAFESSKCERAMVQEAVANEMDPKAAHDCQEEKSVKKKE